MRREFSIEVAYRDIRRISEENIGFVFLVSLKLKLL